MALARLARVLVLSAATAFAVTMVVPAYIYAQDAAAAPKKKYIPPVKGVARVQMTKPAPKPDGKDIVTVIKIKNLMEGTIAGLRADEYWYDKSNKMVAGDTQRVRTPIQPGEVVTITFRTPRAPGMNSSQYQLSHANGTIKAESVAKIE